MKLYDASPSPTSKRILVCVAELGLDIERVHMEFGPALKTPEYLALNPMGLVPTFVDDDGFVLWESSAVLFLLASRDPQRRLLPPDPRSQSDALRWMFWNSSHLEPAGRGVVVERLIKAEVMNLPPDEEAVAASLEALHGVLPVLDAHLSQRSWLIDGGYSIADIDLGTFVELLPAARVDMSRYPHVLRWLTALQTRTSWSQ